LVRVLVDFAFNHPSSDYWVSGGQGRHSCCRSLKHIRRSPSYVRIHRAIDG